MNYSGHEHLIQCLTGMLLGDTRTRDSLSGGACSFVGVRAGARFPNAFESPVDDLWA